MLRDFPMEEYGFFLWRFVVFALSLHRKQEVKLLNIIDMKRFHTLMTMVAIAMLSFTVTSCDEDEYIADTLWGTWEGDMYVSSYWNNRYYDSSYTVISFNRTGNYSGTGYWIDYYNDAPWGNKYIATHIRWIVSGGNINITFIEDNYDITIYRFSLSNDYFDGEINTYDNKRVEFHLEKTSPPDWDRYYWGSDYHRWFTRGAMDTLNVEKPQRMFRVRE